MIWYYDLLVMFGVVVVGVVAGIMLSPKPGKIVTQTKDGYNVTVKEMVELEQSRALHDAVLAKTLNSIFDGSEEDLLVISFFGWLFSYALVGNLIEYLLHVPNEVFGMGFIVLVISLLIAAMKSEMKSGVALIGEMTIEAPAEFKQYGTYAKNPFDVYGTLLKLREEEKDWEITKTRRDNEALAVQEMGREEGRLERYEERLEGLSQRITVQVGLLTNSLLTDNPPEAVRSILKANQKVEIQSPVQSMPPHYIEVMKEIASRPSLPEEVKAQAQELVDAYADNEIEQKRKQEVDDALVEINTVKKFVS